MKKFLVFSLTALAIVALSFVGLVSSRSTFGMSADALAGDVSVEPRAPAPMEMEEADPMMKGGEGQMGKKEMKRAMPIVAAPKSAMSNLFGAADDSVGIGTRGRGGGAGGSGSGIGILGGLADKEANDGEGGTAEPAPTRAWFPETFLFEPLIVTDADGRANVPVKVPDRLTTWRVLALAHSRQGSQAGAVTSFLGTLPTYVDPVTPPFLYAGDVVRLPVQVVNTTDADISTSLTYAATGGALSSDGKSVKVPAGGTALDVVTLTTTTPGAAVFKATLGTTDAVEKRIELKPSGRRVVQNKGGTLAAPRTFELIGVSEPLPGTESVRVQVYPGALGLVRNELSAAPGRGGIAEDAYLLQLLGQAPALLRSLGATPDEKIIRDLSVLATQRVMQYARAPSIDTSTLLTEAALAHPENPVLQRLGERLALQIAQDQRADGTCQGVTGWALQRLLVSTSECVRAARASMATPAARQRATAVTLKASGAFERNAARVNDAYTAASILASGAITGGAGDGFRKLILEKLTDSGDGGKYLPVEAGVVRADGTAPSTYEATAMAILALEGVKEAPVADLGTYLLSGYSTWAGWGDGRANLVALRAAVKLFKDPVPADVKITLSRDGKVLSTGTLDANALKDVLTLEADAKGSAGAHQWSLQAEPAVPGLGFSLQLVAYEPWKDVPGGGVDLKVTLPPTMRAGQPAVLTLEAAGPGGVPLELRLSLPAGVQHDTTELNNLVLGGAVSRFETEDGLITLHLTPQRNGAVWSKTVTVTPTLAGTLQSGSSSFGPKGRLRDFAPVKWKID
jgi:hypothetical protein